MKIISILILVFIFSCSVCLSQSKKELKKEISQLNMEKQDLQNEVLTLKQQILDLKEELLNIKTDNERLRTENNNQSNYSTSKLSNTPTETKTDPIIVDGGRCQAITQKGTQCLRNADPGSNYCWQHKSNYKSNNSGSTNSGQTIYTGPRGGKYYINSHGNKTYIKH
jgi:hypothetical protein